MSSPETSPYGLDQLHAAMDYLVAEADLKDAALVMPALIPECEADRIHKCGLGLAEVVLRDGSSTIQAYILDDTTPEMRTLLEIDESETSGKLQKGSTCTAIESIRRGTFETEWTAHMPRQTD